MCTVRPPPSATKRMANRDRVAASLAGSLPLRHPLEQLAAQRADLRGPGEQGDPAPIPPTTQAADAPRRSGA